MKITRIDRTQATYDKARANSFAGEVRTQSLVSSAESNDLGSAQRLVLAT